MSTDRWAPLSAPEGAHERHAIIEALDHAPVTRAHRVFTIALLAALAFDYMKPFTISFVIPGVRAEWGLSQTTASYLAVAGLTGTMIGSLFWGYVADRIGRRTALLWTIGIYTVGSLCGATMSYGQALFMCLFMGFGVGGEAPIAFALAAEYLPVRVRARTIAFLGIVGAVLGYVLAALFATVANTFYPPAFAWRLMWLFGLAPAAFILLLRSKVLPESARYLLAHGRVEEARKSAESLVGEIAGSPAPETARRPPVGTPAPVPKTRLYGRTLALSLFSFAWGLANFGFITWLPTLLGTLGYSGTTSSAYLLLSALVALPAVAITALLLTRWSTRWTLVTYAVGGGAVLVVLGAGATGGWLTPVYLVVVSSLAFFFITSLGGAFSLYAAEVFPTRVRANRSGIVAGAGKFGGVVGPYFGGLWLAAGGSALGLQVPLAASLLAAAVLLAMVGVETRGMALEDIDAHSPMRMGKTRHERS